MRRKRCSRAASGRIPCAQVAAAKLACRLALRPVLLAKRVRRRKPNFREKGIDGLLRDMAEEIATLLPKNPIKVMHDKLSEMLARESKGAAADSGAVVGEEGFGCEIQIMSRCGGRERPE